jgi:hypothetical protein
VVHKEVLREVLVSTELVHSLNSRQAATPKAMRTSRMQTSRR